MKLSYTNDVPDMQSRRTSGKWRQVCVELIESGYKAVRVETDSHEEANRVRLAALRAAKRAELDVRPTQRGNIVYIVNMGASDQK